MRQQLHQSEKKLNPIRGFAPIGIPPLSGIGKMGLEYCNDGLMVREGGTTKFKMDNIL
jgi:hypothetical protein